MNIVSSCASCCDVMSSHIRRPFTKAATLAKESPVWRLFLRRAAAWRRRGRGLGSKLPPSARCRFTRCTRCSACVRMSAALVVFSASCRSVTKRRSVLPTLNCVCTISSARWLCDCVSARISLPVARGDLRRQCVFDFAERAQADRGVGGDGLFLLDRPDLDLGLERAAFVDRARAGWHRSSTPGCLWSWSTNSSLEMLLTPVVSEIVGSRAALASPTRLKAAATRRSAATTSGRRSSSSDGSPAGTASGWPG